MILDAKMHTVTNDDARKLILQYVGKRRLEVYMDLYSKEDATLWGLYNALTFYASHGNITTSRREKMISVAAEMLEKELIV